MSNMYLIFFYMNIIMLFMYTYSDQTSNPRTQTVALRVLDGLN
jgi:hypothetical protein